MLPESNFPVTGGTMQTEEVVPRAQSTGIDLDLTDNSLQNHLHLHHHHHHSTQIKCPLAPLAQMAVKQEPQEEEERSRDTSTLSPQTDTSSVQVSLDGKHGNDQQSVHHRQLQTLEETPGQTCASDQSNRSRSSRGRRKSRWKLKFHHQALPPEYLDHYEASLAQEALNSSSPTHTSEQTAPSPAPTSATSTPSPIADVQGWLQRIAAMQQELCPQTMPQQCTNFNSGQASASRRSVITSTSSHAYTVPPHHHHHHHNHNHNHGHVQQSSQQTSTTRPPMKYSDLPYMGEITLDNSKPRRGRKPKKADICHLIYKNYGTILPGTPGHEEKRLSPQEKPDCRDQLPPQIPFQRTDVQNRISSLLEKRLTQETRRNFVLTDTTNEQDEPLNLCIRDLNQLKIRLLRKHGNVYESGQVKSEASSDGEDIECLGTTFPNSANRLTDSTNHVNNNNNNNVNHGSDGSTDPMVTPNPGFVYFPNAGVFIHPMALQSQLLYYQKMAQNDKCFPRGTEYSQKEQKIVPKSIYSMMDTKSSSSVSPTTPTTPQPSTVPVPAPLSPRPKRNAPVAQHQGQPTKRKRSAIFIPPMPSENNNNPATEVSICKFKFTGGAKPSLQEKKSLSVDSGGNFRYYSGTGDKSMRGYEFFPREALQQQAGQSGSSAGAFLNASGERVQPPVVCQRSNSQEDGRRKRKTRKSLQREKLEQTFKEKGFLIQTQQLESAEGATYCKFRQLRKFTRYLFRSWKDYLPGNVRELSNNGEGEIVEGDVESDATGIVPSPISHQNLDGSPTFVEDHRTLPLT
ncbi:PREDICTED: putative uncharacterized protein DDB_G0279653 isoform X1 [Polistes canadensis]|uniref:putative uncharacterized protein DDB_G0279653 isoform X1 n=2 Tax=Polistes canadensis TaxID=91411 RepID=UPI000718F493|nr:PREDICTED: putative uncharacterized protein DDB_G0279653 isoform X1 [Polistes canadensis]